MPLVRKHGSTAPRELALFWSMRTDAGENVDVYVYASSLQAFDTAAIGFVGLMKRHRDLLEKVASDKFDLLGIDVRHPLHISTDDLLHG